MAGDNCRGGFEGFGADLVIANQARIEFVDGAAIRRFVERGDGVLLCFLFEAFGFGFQITDQCGFFMVFSGGC